MKRILLLLPFLLIGMASLQAQVSYSCTYRQYCLWNEDTKKFGECEGYEDFSLFEWNKEETMFTHTIESMKSTYYVKSKKYDEDNKLWTFNVTSDVGNKYFYIFDDKNKEIRAVFERDGKTQMVVFTVKAIF